VHWLAPFKQGLGALWSEQSLAAIGLEVEHVGATYLVIDSVVFACAGADPVKPETPMLYASALQIIGLPSLSLAHVNRQHDPRYPFGSVFWHNAARITWSLLEKGGDTLLQNRKASNYDTPKAQTVTFTWWEGTLREVAERPAALTLLDRITDALSGEPLSVADICDALNDGLDDDQKVRTNTVRSILSRDLRKGKASLVTTAGEGTWTLREVE
jgi:hypothetical protein